MASNSDIASLNTKVHAYICRQGCITLNMSRPLYIIATENSENQSNRMFLTDLAGSFTSHLMLTPAQESGMISLLRMSVDDSYENTSNNITALFMSNKVIMLSLSNATYTIPPRRHYYCHTRQLVLAEPKLHLNSRDAPTQVFIGGDVSI